ncbi:hypothetical protein, partial [Desulfovibrio piger]
PFVKADNIFKQPIIKTKKILLKPHHSSAFMTLIQAGCCPDNSLPGHHRIRVHKNILHFFLVGGIRLLPLGGHRLRRKVKATFSPPP